MDTDLIMVCGTVNSRPVINKDPQNKSVCNFELAVSKGKPDGTVSEKIFTICAWNKLGENMWGHLCEGDEVSIVGECFADGYLDKDNQPRARLRINVKHAVYSPEAIARFANAQR